MAATLGKSRWSPGASSPGLKRCSRCLWEYPATAEYFHRSGNIADGFHTRCKGCRLAHMKVYHGSSGLVLTQILHARLGVGKCYACNRAVPLALMARRRAGASSKCKSCTAAHVRSNWRGLTPSERKARSFEKNSKTGRNLRLDPNTRPYIKVLSLDPCSYCGGRTEQIDHIDPVANGGSGSWDNLTASCARCNQAKKTKSLLEFLLTP